MSAPHEDVAEDDVVLEHRSELFELTAAMEVALRRAAEQLGLELEPKAP